MKRTILFFAIITGVLSVGMTSAQIATRTASLVRTMDSAGRPGAVITYTGLENPELKVFTALVPASVGACAFNFNLANLQLADPSVASLSYDQSEGTYKLKWTPSIAASDTCQVVLVRDGDQDVDASDLAIWRNSFGSSAFAEEFGSKNDARSLPAVPAYSIVIDPRP